MVAEEVPEIKMLEAGGASELLYSEGYLREGRREGGREGGYE